MASRLQMPVFPFYRIPAPEAKRYAVLCLDSFRVKSHRHPALEEFVSLPATALIEVAIEQYCLVRQFQQVTVLEVSQPECRQSR